MIVLFTIECVDHRQKKIPNWFLKVKLGTSLVTVLSMCGIMYLVSQHGDKLKMRHDPFKKFIPEKSEIIGSK